MHPMGGSNVGSLKNALADYAEWRLHDTIADPGKLHFASGAKSVPNVFSFFYLLSIP
jgi:hypothetical protein